MLEDILKELELDKQETKIYLNLLQLGGSTAGELAKKMGMVRPTLYNYLQAMTEKGIVIRSLKQGVRYFYAEQPENLEILFEKKIKYLSAKKQKLHSLLPALSQFRGGSYIKPQVQFFEGKEGLQNIYNDILLYNDIDTCTFWPAKSMIKVLPDDYLAYHTEQRLIRNIKIRGIWPPSEAVDVKKYKYMGSGDQWLRYVRIAPDDVKFSMGVWIYANKVAFISSVKESFGMIIESKDLAEVQQAQWNLLWKISKPL